jgi:protein gp37
MYKRFKWNEEIKFNFFDSLLSKGNPKVKDGSRVFVCSTFEIFHPSVKKEWRDEIFATIMLNMNVTFIVLTKMPENIDREMPENCWLGISVTSPVDYYKRIGYLEDAFAWTKFMSLEPLIEYYSPTFGEIEISDLLSWVIVGKMTGHGNKHDPRKDWIEDIIEKTKELDIPIFMKDNLRSIWKDDLIQEYPR